MENKLEAKLAQDKMPRQKAVRSSLPSAVTALRLVAFPFLISSLSNGQSTVASFLFIFAIASDLADGYLAKKLRVCSKIGGYFDAAVDFLFIGGVFLNFVIIGTYPIWVLVLITAMFAQFIVTSTLLKVIYDPIGKYYGSLLYGAIGLTILVSGQTAQNIILSSLLVVSAISFSCRLLYTLKKKHQQVKTN
jgi:phosphatidylglycerophosphate synthase